MEELNREQMERNRSLSPDGQLWAEKLDAFAFKFKTLCDEEFAGYSMYTVLNINLGVKDYTQVICEDRCVATWEDDKLISRSVDRPLF